MLPPVPFAGQDEACMYCEQTPRTGAWGKPCLDSPDALHWTQEQRELGHEAKLHAVARSLSRAAYELDKVASDIEQLPQRQQRKLSTGPDLIRNEAERARDTLYVYGLLDV